MKLIKMLKIITTLGEQPFLSISAKSFSASIYLHVLHILRRMILLLTYLLELIHFKLLLLLACIGACLFFRVSTFFRNIEKDCKYLFWRIEDENSSCTCIVHRT